MRVLLTGGSGTVGQQVLKQLSDKEGIDIIAFDIKNKKTQKIYKPYRKKIKIHYGDLSKMKDVLTICKGIDFVIHLAAIIPPLADENPRLANKVNVNGTKNLINSLETYSTNAFFLYASSVSVYGDRLDNPLIKVGDSLRPSEGDEYAKTKIKAERIIRKSKLNWSIFRLSAIMGMNNHKVSGMMFHMPLSTLMEITTPEDTASAFVNAIEKKKLLEERIFNLGGGEKCRIPYHDFLSKSFLISGLGQLDFPPNAFAEKNFHCGYYKDGDALEDILKFRKDTMESYFEDLENAVSPIKKIATRVFKKRIKSHLLKQSEPFKAVVEKDELLLERFFDVRSN